MLSYLGRFGVAISCPMDVVRVFQGLTVGQRHQMIRSVRSLLKFYEVQGLAREGWLNLLRKNIPKDDVGFDLKVPSEEDIIRSLRLMREALPKYRALYSVVLDSGLRLVEAVRLINGFGSVGLQRCDGFCVAPLGYLRKCKLAYYGFFTTGTMELIKEVGEQLESRNATPYLTGKGPTRRPRRAIVTWKYLRKFAFDKMIELEVPESVADFIQGRTPRSVGAKHYMVLVRQAEKYYPRYAEYLRELKRKALT